MCDGLLADLAKLKDKQRLNTEAMLRLVDTVSAAVEQAANPSTHPPTHTPATDTILPKLADQHKSYHASLSKYTKAVDRVFSEGPPFVCRPSLTLPTHLVDEMVALHLYREGKPKTALKLVEEAGLSPSVSAQLSAYEGLQEVHEVIGAAMGKEGRNRDLAPACAWVAKNREGLRKMGSNLEFQLARLQYLLLLMEGEGKENAGGGGEGQREEKDHYGAALAFAREHLAPFIQATAAGEQQTHTHTQNQPTPTPNPHQGQEVRALMGCLLYAGRLQSSPYRSLLSHTLWQDAMTTLHTDSCRLLSLPVESPLSVCYRASLRALGPLAKMKQVVMNSKGDWDSLEELPGEINLGSGNTHTHTHTHTHTQGLRFHSIFSCPVTREQASASNPPMMLKCGHVICKKSLVRLMKGGPRAKFKCFVCPVEQYGEETMELYF